MLTGDRKICAATSLVKSVLSILRHRLAAIVRQNYRNNTEGFKREEVFSPRERECCFLKLLCILTAVVFAPEQTGADREVDGTNNLRGMSMTQVYINTRFRYDADDRGGNNR